MHNLKLEQVRKTFDLNEAIFKSIVKGFKTEYEQGLSTRSASGLATMIPSYVTTLPTGQETGTYLSLDLGGSTLRVSAVELLGNCQVKVTEIRRQISPHDPLRTSRATVFFDWIVDAIAELIDTIGYQQCKEEPLSLGICWSFPIDQTSISKGKILRMGKGFTIDGIEGQDLSSLFHKAFERKSLYVKVTALLNDTIGTLVAHAYTNPDARVGFIYGTGVNAAYPEKVNKILKLHQSEYQKDDTTRMLVNTEIDIFGSDAYLPLNKYDRLLDASHSQPQFQLYEKMMSGACIGELVRLVAIDLIRDGHLFNGHEPKEFEKYMAFETSTTGDIESHFSTDSEEEGFSQFQQVFHFDGQEYQVEMKDYRLLREVCRIVSDRAARLAGAAMASLIEQQSEDLLVNSTKPIVIGVNGSTYEKYPGMHERIHESLVAWFGPDISARIRVELATDGGSIGGALIAMLSEKESSKPRQATRTKSHPASPSFFGCCFGWLSVLRTIRKKETHETVTVDERK
ncbi:MAG: hypothetical protein EXX96DRAFT_573920 [Benjaminiella poitrasii]|nr:MAG: hypothetical protein EXX96DRAFT_573920 [Benjaminiella poitrasii]